MNRNETTMLYWKKASMYGMLAQYYMYMAPDKAAYYAKLHCEWMTKLAECVERYGDPFDTYKQAAAAPAASPYGYQEPVSGYPAYPAYPAGMFPGMLAGQMAQTPYVGYGTGIYPPQGRPNLYTSYNAQPIRMELSNARIRILHASPDAPAVDIYANGKLIASDLAYKGIVPYVNVQAGQYVIDVYAAGQHDKPVLSQTMTVQAGKSYTLAAGNKMKDLMLYAYIDDPAPAAGKAKGKFIHLSPDAPNVDIRVKDGAALFSNVPFGQSTAYITVAPGTLDLQVAATGTNQVVLEVPGIALSPDSVSTIIAVGWEEGTSPLEAMLLSDL